MTVTWLKPAKNKATFTCPICRKDWLYLGPFNPVKFRCGFCSVLLTWKETDEFEPYKAKVCRKCNTLMEKRYGQYGEFFGCERWPDCQCTRWIEQWRLRRKVTIAIAP